MDNLQCIPVVLRRWVSPLQLSEFDQASISPDNALLVLQSYRKNLIAIYELKQDAKFTSARLSWPALGGLHWVTSKIHSCLITTTDQSLDFYVFTKVSALPLYTRELKICNVTESTGAGSELIRVEPQPNAIVQYVFTFPYIQEKIAQKLSGFKFVSFELLGTTSNNSLVAFLDFRYVLVFSFDQQSRLSVHRLFSIPVSGPEKPQVWLKHNWICFASPPTISIWNIEGTQQAQFPIFSLVSSCQSTELNTKPSIAQLDLSCDLKYLSVIDGTSRLTVFDLDQLYREGQTTFHSFPVVEFNADEEPSEEEFEEVPDWHVYMESKKTKVEISLRMTSWWEYDIAAKVMDLTPSSRPKSNSQPQITSVVLEDGFLLTRQQAPSVKFPHKEESKPAPSLPLNLAHVVNGFSFKQIKETTGAPFGLDRLFVEPGLTDASVIPRDPQALKPGITGHLSLDKYLKGHVVNQILISPTQVLVATSPQNNPLTHDLIFFSRPDLTARYEYTFEKDSFCLLPMAHHLSLFYYLTSDGLHSIVPGTIEGLTDSLIIFHGPQLAESLYKINAWDCRSLRLHTLGMGLRFRQMDVIVPAIQSLDQDQELVGSQMLLKYLQSSEMAIQDQFFIEQVLKIAMEFVATAMMRKVQEMKEGISQDQLGTLETFSLLLKRLQAVKIDLVNTKAKGKKITVQLDDKTPSHRWKKLNLITQKSQGPSDIDDKAFLVSDLEMPTSASDGYSTDARRLSLFSDDEVTFSDKKAVLLKKDSQDTTSDTTDDPRVSSGGSSAPQTESVLESKNWSLNEENISALDEIALSFGSYRDVWEKMTNLQIIRNALTCPKSLSGADISRGVSNPGETHITTSNLSLALSYLRWRHQKRKIVDEPVPDLKWLKELGFRLVYQEILKGDLDLASLMLNNIGEEIFQHSTEIAWKTTRRAVRDQLVSYLKRNNCLSKRQFRVIHWANLVQDFYPNWEYKTEFQKLISMKQGNTVAAGNMLIAQAAQTMGDDAQKPILKCGDLDDLSEETKLSLGFQASEKLMLGGENQDQPSPASPKKSVGFVAKGKDSAIVLNSGPRPSKIGAGYAHFRLCWLDQWEPETLYRVLFESCINNGYDMQRIDSLLQAEQANYFLTQLKFYVVHNDWNRLIQWVDKISIDGYTLDKYGQVHQIANGSGQPAPPAAMALGDLVSAIKSQFRYCTPLVAEILRNKLAQRGFFFDFSDLSVQRPETESLDDSPPELSSFDQFAQNQKSFACLLRTLATVDRLFSSMNTSAQYSLSLKELCPTGAISPFHLYNIQYFIENKLLGILDVYLDSHGLAKTPEQIEELRTELGYTSTLEASLAELFFLFRNHKDLYTLALLNSQMCLTVGDHSTQKERNLMTLQRIFELTLDGKGEHTSLMPLSTLLCSVGGFQDSLTENTTSPYYVHPNLIERAVASYNTLKSALFPSNQGHSIVMGKSIRFTDRQYDLISSAQDINLCQLLYGCSPFSLDELFKHSPKRKRGKTQLSFPIFDGEEFAAERYTDVIDMKYYIANGQPFHAFDFITNDGITLTLSEKKSILSTVRSTALCNLFDSIILSSCLCFLELCRIETLTLRVDIAAAKRIFLWKKYLLEKNSPAAAQKRVPGAEDKKMMNEVIEYFLALDGNDSNQKLSAILEMLRQSVKDQGLDTSTVLNTGPGKSDEFLSSNKWKLVSLFTSVHQMKPDLTILKVYAKNDDWVNFMTEAHLLNCPIAKVRTIASTHFSKSTLKAHVLLSLKQMEPEETTKTEIKSTTQIFTLISQALKSSSPGTWFLKEAISLKRPFLSLLAACFEVPVVLAFNVWSHASYLDPDWSSNDVQADLLTCGVNFTQTKNGQMFIPSLQTGRNSNLLNEFEAILSILLRRQQFIHLLTGFELFASSHIIIDWVKFEQYFAQYRFSDAQAALNNFVKNLRSPDFPLVFKFGDLDWTENIVSHLADRMLLRLPTLYERLHFLELTARSQFSPRHVKLYSVFILLQGVGLTDQIPITNQLPDSSYIIQLFLSKELYTEARTFAEETKANRSHFDEITVCQVKNMLQTRENNSKHFQDDTTYLMEWDKINDVFLLYCCSPSVVGPFYLSIEQSLDSQSDVMESPSRIDFKIAKKNASERIKLLNLAIAWLNGTYNQQVALFPETSKGGTFDEADEPIMTWSTKEFLDSLDEKILQITIQLEILSLKQQQPLRDSRKRRKSTLKPAAQPTKGGLPPKAKEPLLPPGSKDPTQPTRRKLLSDFDNPSIEWQSQSGGHSKSPNTNPFIEVSSPPSHSNPFDRDYRPQIFEQRESPLRDRDVSPGPDPSILEIIVGRLLNEGNISEAERVQKQFGHTSIEYEIITEMLHLAGGLLAGQFVNPKLLSLLSNDSRIDPNRVNKTELLAALARKCVYSQQYANCILVQFSVAQLLNTTFENLVQKDTYDVLRLLLMQGYEKCQLIKDFVAHCRLDTTMTASVLSNHCLNSILNGPGLCDDQAKEFIMNVLDVSRVGNDPSTPPRKPKSQSDRFTSSNSDTDVSSEEPQPEPKSAEIFSSTPSLPPRAFSTPGITHSLSGISTPARLQQILTTPSTPIRDHLSSWSSTSNGTIGTTTQEFIDFISLAGNPEKVGYSLLSRLTPLMQSEVPGTDAFEVEVLIHSHFCFLAATHMAGIDQVLELILQRVHFYVKRREFKLLVRLLTGTKEYTRLESILHLLTAHDCFEMMLAKHVVMNEEGKRELKLALFHFLKNHHSDDASKMKLVFLRFGMFREYAHLIHSKAVNKLGRLANIKTTFAQLCPLLLESMERLLDAADNYQKARALKKAQECFEQAELIALQLEQPEIPCLNLSKAQVRQLMAFGGVFEHSYVLSCAYNLNLLEEWIIPVYNQVIECGNFEYFSDFSLRIRFGDELFVEIVRKWKTSTSRKTSHVNHLKKFLGYVDDCYIRYQLAQSLGAPFKSIVADLEKEAPWVLERQRS